MKLTLTEHGSLRRDYHLVVWMYGMVRNESEAHRPTIFRGSDGYTSGHIKDCAGLVRYSNCVRIIL